MHMTEQQVQATVSFLQVREASGVAYNCPNAVYTNMLQEATIDRECVWVAHLNTKHKIIEKELVSMGTLKYAIIEPRQIFRKAIINNADCIIIIHNHPSGDPSPSESDIESSKRLRTAANLLDIDILDFIIIGASGYLSFADEGVGGFA